MITELGKLLRIIRINSNESGRNMAEKFCISAAYLSAIEMGKRGIPQNFEELIFKHYDLSPLDQAKIRKAIIDSSERIKIDLTDLSDKKKKILFALRKGMDESTLDKLCEIINNNEKPNKKEKV